MKKNCILSLLLLFYFNQIHSQVVETLFQHSKIKDGMYVDADSNVYTTSGGLQNGTEIGKYSVSDNTFNFAFQTGFFGPIDIDERANGDYVVTNFDNNTVSTVDLSTGVVDVIATGLDGPAGIAIDENDNIYVSNFGAPPNYTGHQIHKITPGGTVSILADSPLLFRFQAMIFNGEGELIVSSQDKLLKVDIETGDIEIWVDLVNTGFGHMIYRELDTSIYGTATDQSKIYKVDAAGTATVYAGSVAGYQDGNLATALFNNPLGLGISPNENILYVGDSNSLRRIIMDVNLGTEEHDFSSHVVYPNPSSNGMFNVTNTNGEAIFIEVFDQIGRQVLSMEDDNSLITLNLADKDQGIYYLRLNYDSQVILKKLVKYN